MSLTNLSLESVLFCTVIKKMQHIDKIIRFNGQKYLKSDHPQDKTKPTMCAITGENKGITTLITDCFSITIITHQIIIPIRKSKPDLQINILVNLL